MIGFLESGNQPYFRKSRDTILAYWRNIFNQIFSCFLSIVINQMDRRETFLMIVSRCVLSETSNFFWCQSNFSNVLESSHGFSYFGLPIHVSFLFLNLETLFFTIQLTQLFLLSPKSKFVLNLTFSIIFTK